MKYFTRNGRGWYSILCDCGETFERRADSKTKKCKKCRGLKGLSKTKLYKVYHGIKQRCYNENNQDYCLYGGKGIKLSEEWLNDFILFYDWSNLNGYKDGLVIDRIDPSKGYSAENCNWITPEANSSRATRRSSRGKNSKLTVEEANEAMKMLSSKNYTYRAIAEKYNVTPGCINNIRKRKNGLDV